MSQIDSQEVKDDLIRLFEEACQYEENGNLEMASELTRDILEKYPGQPHALQWLGFHALNTGESRRAIPYLNEAHHADPSNFDVVVGLARAMLDASMNYDARIVFERALKMKPGDKEITLQLGEVYRLVGEPKKAEKLYKSLLVETPGDPYALVGLAHLARAKGNLKKATDYVRRALEMPQQGAEAYVIFSELQKFKEVPPELERIRDLAGELKEGSRPRLALKFAVGKILDDVGDYEGAFRAFDGANHEIESSYSEELVEERFNSQIEVFNPAFVESSREFGSDSERPVFVVGMPRSGTSLVEQILASHPEVFGAGELQYVSDMRVHVIPKYIGVGHTYPESVTMLEPDGIKGLADHYLEKSAQYAGDEPRITDKLPHNFVNVGLISILFPNAKIIHCNRDPMDTCLSIYMRNFSDSFEFATRLENLGHHYRQYLKIMDHWRGFLSDNILDVQYEDLTADQERVSRQMVEHIGLPWDDRCLDFNKTERSVNTFSHWQVRQPIYRSSIARWKNYEPWLGRLKEALEPND